MEHLLQQVRRQLDFLDSVSVRRKDLGEVAARNVVDLVDQLYFLVVHLLGHRLQFIFGGQTQNRDLLNKLAALSFAGEKGAQGHEFSKDAPDG